MNTLSAKGAIAALALLIAIAGLLLAGFAPRYPVPQPLVASTPTPTAITFTPINPKIGLHTRLTDEPKQANITREFQMLREMGATWATEFFPWAYIQPTDKLRYDWDHADKVADAAKAAGVTLLARLDGVPTWAHPANTTWKYLDEAHYADYGDFVYAFVSHFKGRISYYIIWNEPNTAAEWGQRPPDPKAYADLLKIAYTRAKEADPNCVVLLAGLAPNLEHEGSTLAMNDLTFLNRLYDAGAAPYFDAVAVHAYGLTTAPNDPPAPNKLNFARVEELHNVMVQRGDSAKFVYITEGGWNDSPRWSFAVTPYERTEYTLDAIPHGRAVGVVQSCVPVGLPPPQTSLHLL